MYVTALSSCITANISHYGVKSAKTRQAVQWAVGCRVLDVCTRGGYLFWFIQKHSIAHCCGMDKMSPLNIAVVLAAFLVLANAGDMMRKSIVFDKNTPDVFYCPQRKPTGFDKLIVHSRPLSKLCQFEGGPIPQDYKSDCYNDVDETEYACKEKYRIMKRFQNGDEDKEENDNGFPNA